MRANFMKQDLLIKATVSEVEELVKKVFPHATKIKVETSNSETTEFDITYEINPTYFTSPAAYSAKKHSAKLSKFGFVIDGKVVPDGLVEVIKFLSTKVPKDYVEEFSNEFIEHLSISLRNQGFEEYNQMLAKADEDYQYTKKTQKDKTEYNQKCTEISKNYQQSIKMLGEYLGSVRDDLNEIFLSQSQPQ